jgi:hypothetical protein
MSILGVGFMDLMGEFLVLICIVLMGFDRNRLIKFRSWWLFVRE